MVDEFFRLSRHVLQNRIGRGQVVDGYLFILLEETLKEIPQKQLDAVKIIHG
ncbi:hypothetical protein [Pseudodesulfovibrio alkaliphilus]|uniref:hypothetical protein n=1 Tax=Pseudodesulfovibrio alkaliphilus TaxID=2661613 RepID=UPI0018C87704|nr:hypothetical protein [Pseudodesulfovibrio alkaliphilus]